MSNQSVDVVCVASARSLSYASVCLESLLQRCLDTVRLVLIVDDSADRDAFHAAADAWRYPKRHAIEFRLVTETGIGSGDPLGKYPHVRSLQQGHPCWRKNVDPFLVSDREEVVIIDPDVYFLRTFRFPISSEHAIRLMWQRPNCLHPPAAVDDAFASGASLADHTDIGVAIVSKQIDWEWLDWFLSHLSLQQYRSYMHIESIVWAALAMRHGGGYLDPARWVCYQHNWSAKIRTRLGGNFHFQMPQLDLAVALHAGGVAKHVFLDVIRQQRLGPGNELLNPADEYCMPFEAFTATKWRWKKRRLYVQRSFGFGRS